MKSGLDLALIGAVSWPQRATGLPRVSSIRQQQVVRTQYLVGATGMSSYENDAAPADNKPASSPNEVSLVDTFTIFFFYSTHK